MKVFKIFCAAFLAVWLPLMAHVVAERYFPVSPVGTAALVGEKPRAASAEQAAPSAAPSAAAPSAAPEVAALDPVAAGAKVAKKCAACHSFEDGGANKVGPNLFGIVDAPVAAKGDFAYSEDLKALGGVWSTDRLVSWVTDPKAMAPKTKMAFAGLKSEQERKDLMSYLESLKH